MSDVPVAPANDEECEIPVVIADEEKIVRAVFNNHLERNRLRSNFFDHPQDQASVMRHSHMGTRECKRRARNIKPGNPNLKYRGMAVIQARAIRDAEGEVVDSREVYCGHAHVSVDVEMPPPGDPLESERKFQRDQRLRSLARSARYIADPDPDDAEWTGDDI